MQDLPSLLVRQAFDLADSLALAAVVACVADRRDVQVIRGVRKPTRTLWLVDHPEAITPLEHDEIIALPASASALRRSGSRLRLGLFLAAVSGHVQLDDDVVCLLAGIRDGRLDTIVVTNPRREFPGLGADDRIDLLRPLASGTALVGVIEVAVRLAGEGREGRPIGATFVVGDPEQLAPHLRQLILNPCLGHPRDRRNINQAGFLETVREFAAMDGAFVIDRNDGAVESAGTFLNAPAQEVRIGRGLGARHAAAAALTSATDAAAVVVSESSGTVTVFHGGAAILTFDEP